VARGSGVARTQGRVSRLVAYRELLWLLTLRELKAKHRQTLLGVGWALLQPIAMMVVFTAVFSVFVRVPVAGMPYAAFAYSGLICWLFLANSVAAGTSSLISNMNLITKAAFPREVIPLATILTAGFDFLIGLALLAVLVLALGVPPTGAWLAVPLIAAVQVALIVGLVLWSSALNVLRRDLGSLLPLALQIWMFLSPVVYPVSVIPEPYRAVYMLNPAAMLLEAYRSAIFLGSVPVAESLAPAAVVAGLALVSGYAYFKSVESRFADVM
jgi:lipopolysaccharide transport system permease protein